MVQWTVALATRIPSDKLAQVSSYDALGSMGATPLGALIAGPIATAIGFAPTQFAASALIVVVSALCLIPRDIRTIPAMTSCSPTRVTRACPSRFRRTALTVNGGSASGYPNMFVASPVPARYFQWVSGSGPRSSTVLMANVDLASVTEGIARIWSSSTCSYLARSGTAASTRKSSAPETT